MVDTRSIKAFAQKVLGCGCPEEVFEQIEHHRVANADSQHPDQRILIGERLLIYTKRCNDLVEAQEGLTALVRQGLEERDRLGYNRLRLVLYGDFAEPVSAQLRQAFDANYGQDERLHLHLLPAAAWSSFDAPD